MNLTDLLSGSVISSIAGQTGTSEKDTQNVLANALPALVGAMAQNASTEDGANSLAKALDDHTSSKGLASLLPECGYGGWRQDPYQDSGRGN